MRNEKNHLLVIALHLVDDLFALPVNAGKDFLRIAQASSAIITIACGAEAYMASIIASRSARFFRETVQQVNLRRRRELLPDAHQTAEFAEDRIAKGGGVSAIPAKAKTPARRPSSAAVKRIFQT
jgi:hypothetical protein